MHNRPFRILVVEDHYPDVELLQEALNQVGLSFEMKNAVDGAQALEMIRNADESIDGFIPELVLLDLNLPFINGVSVLKALRSSEHLRHVAVIIRSGSRVFEERSSIEALGAEMFWSKTPGFDGVLDLADTIKAIAINL